MLNSRKQDQLEAAAAEMTGEVEIFACQRRRRRRR